MSKGKMVIAAPGSGRGKTMITIGLIKLLQKKGYEVSSFKCGPDYIDPMFHKRVLNVPSGNLDLFFTDEKTTRKLFEKRSVAKGENHISIVEGVMGLYDGTANTSEASTYHVAKVIDSPVILIVDCKGMSYSALAVIRGFLDMDSEGLISGVILNRTSKKVFDSLKTSIEKMGVSALGYVPVIKDFNLQSRHLGLMMPHEIDNLDAEIDKLTDILDGSIDTEQLLEVAYGRAGTGNKTESESDAKDNGDDKDKIRIAVAMDEAFCFYYEENLGLLESLGARIVPFSPIHDEKLPDNIAGLILGGGYPELYAGQLSSNISMRQSIANAIEKGMPSLAECGGFMYLHKRIITDEAQNNAFEMAGVIDADCYYTGKLVRFGYISFTDSESRFMENDSAGKTIRGHEFHYFDSTANGEDADIVKVSGNIQYKAGYLADNHCWSFAHLYYLSNTSFIKTFIKNCRRFI